MPVRIYEIAKKLGLPSKVVLEKAKELGIAAAKAASCSLDKITAEYLEQQLPKPEAAESPEKGKKTRKGPGASSSRKGASESKTEDAETEAKPTVSDGVVLASPVPSSVPGMKAGDGASPKSQDQEEIEAFVQQGLEELESSSGAGSHESHRGGKFSRSAKRESNESQKGSRKAEQPVASTTGPAEAPETKEPPKAEVPVAPVVVPQLRQPVVPSVQKLMQSAAQKAAEVKEAETKPAEQPQAEPKTPDPVSTPAPVVPAPVQQPTQPAPAPKAVVPEKKAEAPASVVKPVETPAKQQPASAAGEQKQAPTPAAPPVFGMKPLWKIPLSAISRRLSDDNKPAESTASAEVKKPEEATPAEPTQLGQKIGFIQLPQKSAPAPKQQDKQAVKNKDLQKRDRNGRVIGPNNQQRNGQQPFQRQGGGGSFSQGQGRPQQAPNRQQMNGRPQQQQTGGGGRPQGMRYQQSSQQGGGRDRDRMRNMQQPRGKGDRPQRPEPGKEATALPKVPENAGVITMKAPVVVRQLAEMLNRKPFQLIADLMEVGVFANVNQSIEESVARKLCAKHGFRFELEKREKGAALVKGDQKKIEIVDVDDKPEDLKLRPPVVTIMGHVDHGKTTLLDAIRKSNVAAGEAGGITQHIGAYTISIPHPEDKSKLQRITFLDTPGHEAFSAMRARGADVTDIVILVVAANDGAMPQTIEAIRHAQAAKVTIMVAVNKCDLPGANTLRARQQLQDYGLLCEEWGGETVFVDVSALTKTGVDKLLELLVLQAEILELKANPDRKAKGNVIESGLAPGGPTATVLVLNGTLKLGDAILCGEFYGKARALINEEGQRLKSAGPSEAVKLLGLNGVPEAGTEFQVVESEKIARDMAEAERDRNRIEGNRDNDRHVTLEGFLENFSSESDVKVLKVIVKGDTQGSVEAIVDALKKIESSKVDLDIIHSAVGTITESDVILASASRAVIIGFHTRVDSSATDAARREGVQIKLYSIIYELIEQVRDAMAGLLDPILKEQPLGQAEVRQVFNLSKAGSVAGCMITQGKVVKGRCRVMRGNDKLFEGTIQSLRHFHDEVNELKAGMECGIRVDGFHDYKEGDIIQSYSVEKIAQQL